MDHRSSHMTPNSQIVLTFHIDFVVSVSWELRAMTTALFTTAWCTHELVEEKNINCNWKNYLVEIMNEPLAVVDLVIPSIL